MSPLAGLERTVGPDLLNKIQSSKILLIGSGGIGCELLKNLALSGFRSIEVVDLDTIDVSNLNRQLLFRSQHVGKAKCTVACEVASKMVALGDGTADDVSYVPKFGNVCDTTHFNVPFLSDFDLVLNALDNVEARRRVNRLCLAASLPLIEAGTTGYLGQVTVIHKPSEVACYECQTKETAKVYPICTIRSTPSMPVHTIVWAKELYKLIFATKIEDSMLYEGDASKEKEPSGKGGGDEMNENENEDESSEPSMYMPFVVKLREMIESLRVDKENDASKMEALRSVISDAMKGLYCTEITKQLDMGKYKGAKKTPAPFDEKILEEGLDMCFSQPVSQTTTLPTNEAWSLQQCVSVTAKCIMEATTKQGEEVLDEFDKDDDMAMRFVTATSNLRSHVFSIEPQQSLYNAKGIAGNIIPAIATTNAICAGLQIMQVFNILKAQVNLEAKNKGASKTDINSQLNLKTECYYVNCIRNKTRNGLLLTASKLEGPNPKCYVCRHAIIPISLDVEKWTLDIFLRRIVKKRLGLELPTVTLQGDIIWEEGDDADTEAYESNLVKLLPNLPCGGMKHGTVVELEDFSQDLTIQVSIVNKQVWEGEEAASGMEADELPFHVGGDVPKAAAPMPEATGTPQIDPKKKPDPPASGKDDDNDDDDIVVVGADGKEDTVVLIDSDDEDDKKPAAKRQAEDSTDEPAAKRLKASDDVIEIE